MEDYQASLEKLRSDAAEAALIRDLATDMTERKMFDRLAKHLGQLADDVERAINAVDDAYRKLGMTNAHLSPVAKHAHGTGRH